MLAFGDTLTSSLFCFLSAGVTPLSSVWGVAICVLLYFVTIRVLQAWVQFRGKPYDLNWVS